MKLIDQQACYHFHLRLSSHLSCRFNQMVNSLDYHCWDKKKLFIRENYCRFQYLSKNSTLEYTKTKEE